MIALLIILALTINIAYLANFSSLMNRLKSDDDYWASIGRPSSFSTNHISSMLTNLYREGMANACSKIGAASLLNRVRILLPLTFAITGGTLLVLTRSLNSTN